VRRTRLGSDAARNLNATKQVFKRAAIYADEPVCKAVAFSKRASTIAKIIGAMGV
jgi:hypothetical protein